MNRQLNPLEFFPPNARASWHCASDFARSAEVFRVAIGGSLVRNRLFR
jgi:hypothetical protein